MNKKYPWRTGRSCYFKLFYHLIFVSKYHRGVFSKKILTRLQVLFDETCSQMDAKLFEFNGEDDHVHLLISCPPSLSISSLVSKLKGKSSYFLRKEFKDPLKKKLWGKHLWSPSYCAVSSGGATLDVLENYIRNQRKLPNKKFIAQSIRMSRN